MHELDAHGDPIKPGIELEERDEDLAAELNAPRWKADPRGRKALEPKEETKKRLGRSPDNADALVLAFAPVTNTNEINFTFSDDLYTGNQWRP
jgi:hypothetical protein